MSAPIATQCARILLFITLVLEAHGHLREARVPQVPEPPLPAAGSPVEVPLVGSKEAHTADPAICGVLGGLIVLGWVVGCCCAGGAGAAGAGGSEGGAAAGAGLFACVECMGSIASIASLVYVIYSGLLQAWLGGQAVSGWCLVLAVLATVQLVMCVCICCCAGIGASIFGEKFMNEHSKHIFGSHMHDMIHSNKPDAESK